MGQATDGRVPRRGDPKSPHASQGGRPGTAAREARAPRAGGPREDEVLHVAATDILGYLEKLRRFLQHEQSLLSSSTGVSA